MFCSVRIAYDDSSYPFSYPDLPDKPSNTVKCMQSEVHVVIEVHIESSRGMNKGKNAPNI